MDKRFLITTALEETIPTNESLLLLGEWCRPFSKKNKFKNLNIKILPHHWNDRIKLHKDYLYLNEFYEKLLLELTYQLNKIHRTQHKTRYWRILIGPWLGSFVHIIFDRWSSIHAAINNFELLGTYAQSLEEDSFIPNDMINFTRLNKSAEWNYFIYSYIVKNYTTINCIDYNVKYKIRKETLDHQSKFTHRVKKNIFNFVNLICSCFQRDDDFFYINTYLSRKNEILLSLKFFQIPMFYSDNFLHNLDVKVEKEKRQWILQGSNANNFEVFARSIIPKQIPIIYLEGYNLLNKKVSLLSWPSRPKIIFTSSSYYANDLFKLYSAKKTEDGVPLAIGQHGGGIGTHLFAFYEKHQFDICDLYFSWGWTDNSNHKIKSIGMLSAKKTSSINYSSKNRVILVALCQSSQSIHISSTPIASQILDYYEDQCKFISSLNSQIKDNLIVRLRQGDYEPSAERWLAKFPDIAFDYRSSNINKALKECKLCISTYNATTFLETFSMNIPTVMFWNPNHSELREPAKTYFNELKKVGIFHESPESAARHVNMIWQDINSWWSSKAVKEAIFIFKNYYCYNPNNLVNQIYLQLQNEIKKIN